MQPPERNDNIEHMGPGDVDELLATVEAERARSERQRQALRQSVAAIVEAAELTSTDDEHDPEGGTIAYERAQATALLRQATADVEALTILAATLRSGAWPVCTVCGDEIGRERIAALPTTRRCIRCAA